jgi:membrane protease YdiL (CAAX protease family)
MCDARAVRIADPPVPSRLIFWAFVASTLGPFTCSALLACIRRMPIERALSTGRLWRVVGVELLLGLLWLPLLRRRGWSLACVTMPFGAMDLWRALALVAASLLAYWLATFAWVMALPGASPLAHVLPPARLSWWAIGAMSIVNPMAEELVYLGFIVNLLRRRGELSAIMPTIAARMAIHIYQGPVGVVGMAAVGAVFGVYYYRTGRLWPVVIAHGLVDLLSLAQMNALVG